MSYLNSNPSMNNSNTNSSSSNNNGNNDNTNPLAFVGLLSSNSSTVGSNSNLGGGGGLIGGSAIGGSAGSSSSSVGLNAGAGGIGSLGSLGGIGGAGSASPASVLSTTNVNLFGFSNLGGAGVGSGIGIGLGGIGGANGLGVGLGVGVNGGVPAPSAAGPNMTLGAGGLPPPGAAGGSSTGGSGTGAGGVDELLPLVIHLTNPEQREGVLLELSKKRESFPDLAPILWHTYGTVAALLQEIVSIYPLLSPPTLTAHASNRVCNALALLQCVASHPDTRSLFLSAHVPLYLYPFLNTQSKSRPFEYLRLTSLGVVGALVKMDDPDVINFLLQTEIIPLCLRIMETGSELSKTVATFIVQKILLDEIGLSYVCATAERFYAVSTVLNNMIDILVLSPSVRLLKHIVRCYLRLSDNVRAREALRTCLPMSLRDETFGNALRDDVTVKKWLSQLLSAVGPPIDGAAGGGGMMMGGGSTGAGGLGAGGASGLGGGVVGAPGAGSLELGSS